MEDIDYVNVTCSCGYTGSLDKFCRTTISGPLPPGHFQCPACSIAWRRKETDHRILTFGSAKTIIAGKVEIEVIAGRL